MSRDKTNKHNISEQNVIQFLFRNIICRFGVPLQIITDNGTQFTGKKVTKFCEDSGIKLSRSHKSYDNVHTLRKVRDNPGTWADLILEIIWAYKTTIRTPTGHPPFTLAFGKTWPP